MRYILIAILATQFLSYTAIAASVKWTYRTDKDEMDDSKISVASAGVTKANKSYVVLIRCADGKLDAYVRFDTYLGNDSRPVRYRVDKRPLVNEIWLPSAKGTAVFADEDAEFARALSRGNQLLVEVEDFRGVKHRVKFSLEGAAAAIIPVLNDCGASIEAVHDRLPNVSRQVSLNVERLGPKGTEFGKEALKALGYYEGPIDSAKTDKFYIALSSFYQDYLDRCRAGKKVRTYCMAWRNSKYAEGSKPLPSSALYEMAPKRIKSKLGKLRIGD